MKFRQPFSLVRVPVSQVPSGAMIYTEGPIRGPWILGDVDPSWSDCRRIYFHLYDGSVSFWAIELPVPVWYDPTKPIHKLNEKV